MGRRLLILILLFLSSSLMISAKEVGAKPLNFLLITADDLNWDSVGAYGSQVDNITPNIDAFAQQSTLFKHAHVTTGVCQVSRGVLATGLYPHQSGIDGFYHTRKNVPEVITTLQQHGYFTAVKGKVDHSTPRYKTKWDMTEKKAPTRGRDKNKYYEFVRKAIQQAKADSKPFYIMANSHDPHRPFAGSEQERQKGLTGKVPPPSRTYTTDEVTVPEFLPPLTKVQKEIAEYTSSVRRFDDTFGALLKALEDEGVADNTVVTFLSDNGMALPFAKSNSYLNSTKTPWIVRHPQLKKPVTVVENAMISGIDFFPTVLDMAGIDIPKSLSGDSYLPLLHGKGQQDREKVFTMYYETSAANAYPMRAVHDQQYGYIFNPWSATHRKFKNESQSGRSWKAIAAASKNDNELAQRKRFFEHRVLEEFYDFKNDPHALNNLIDDPQYQEMITAKRQQLASWMEETDDPLLAAFENRSDKAFVGSFVVKLQKQSKAKRAARKNAKKQAQNNNKMWEKKVQQVGL